MDTTVTLNLLGYPAAAIGGFVLGTIFGRKLAADALAIVHSIESRLAAIEAMLGLGHSAAAKAAPASVTGHHAATASVPAATAAPATATTTSTTTATAPAGD